MLLSVHKQSPPPLSIFTRIYFSNELRPEIAPDIPFAKAVAALGNATESSPQGQLYPAFKPLDNYDVVMKKTRYYAGSGKAMEQILSTQKIDTVILVCPISKRPCIRSCSLTKISVRHPHIWRYSSHSFPPLRSELPRVCRKQPQLTESSFADTFS